MRWTWILWMGGVLALAGCGGDGGSYRTGADGDRQVDDLSDEELQEACRRLQTFLAEEVFEPREVQRAVCTAVGIYAENTFDGVTCQESVNDCTEEEPDPPDIDGADCDALTSDAVATCDSTVAELEDCVNDIAAAVDRVYSDLDCSLADEEDWDAQLEEILDRFDGPSCSQLDDDCPFADVGVDIDEP
ncbi:MAG: hypothetical protein ACODAU_10090 [Myxococcota bacterium]